MKSVLRSKNNNIFKSAFARYQFTPITPDGYPKPYNLTENLDPNRQYIGLVDEYDK